MLGFLEFLCSILSIYTLTPKPEINLILLGRSHVYIASRCCTSIDLLVCDNVENILPSC